MFKQATHTSPVLSDRIKKAQPIAAGQLKFAFLPPGKHLVTHEHSIRALTLCFSSDTAFRRRVGICGFAAAD
jgi:hypothetical protein